MRIRPVCSLAVLLLTGIAAPNGKYTTFVEKIGDRGLNQLGAYDLLRELTTKIGGRLSGSPQAAKAVEWGEKTMKRLGFDNVHLVPCMVPHWVRGSVEKCSAEDSDGTIQLACCALGGSVGTPAAGVTAPVIEVQSVEEALKLGDKAKGKIIFFNRPFDAALVNTFAQYGKAGDQRFVGPATAAKVGAVAALVRSLTGDPDNVPHTGVTENSSIPCAALSVVAANALSDALKAHPELTVNLKLSCETLPDVPSASVVGELTGTEKPNEVIVMGGHLDSWDKGQGAHDDGAGVTQSLEALHLLKELGFRPKRTIRVVLFMNEENGGRGAEAYAAYAKTAKEKHIAAIESDSGGFAPRSFSCSLKDAGRLNKWLPTLSAFEAEKITGGGGGGADVDPLQAVGAVLFGLEPESQRYFDYHHSDKDTLDKVNPRELELGSLSMATLAWLISEEGI
ncbi:MAG TPA: M20/M25/M40 family metallo-hydrolase [Fimbriimonadaceae bacterium]|nr:M20/M25/M40 family metallo-hydrolase [Fimbriimonadaceae bacterium]